MSWWTLLRRRARWSPVVGAGVVAVLALTALLLATVAVAGPAVVTAGLRGRLAAAPPTQRAVEVSARLDVKAPGPQDAAARRLLTGALAPLAVRVEELREGELLPLGDADGTRLVPWTGPDDLRGHATLTAGRWPSGATAGAGGGIEGVLQADAASALRVGVGDVVRPAAPDAAGPAPPPVAVVGLWVPRDPGDPFWRGQPLPLTGLAREGVRGPLLVDETAAGRLGVDWTARWRAAPDLAEVRADLLAPLSASVAGLRGAVSALPSGGGPSPGAETGLSDLLAGLVPPVRAASGAVRTLLVLLTTVAAALCMLVGATVAGVRAADDAVLRARGGGGAARLLLALREGAGWAVLAAVPAAALAPLAIEVTGRGSPPVPSSLSGVLAALACTGAVALLLVAATSVASRGVARSGGRATTRAGEGMPVRPPTLLVVVVTALAAGWQLESAADAGVAPDDPVLVVAVAVLLASASVLVVTALAALARRVAGAGSRGGPVLALAGWHAGRRGLQPVTAVAVVVLCAAGGVCLLGARQAGRDDATARAHQEVAPVAAVEVPVAPGTPVEAGAALGALVTTRLAALPGVAAVSPVLSIDGTVGSSGSVRVLAVDRKLLPRLTAGAPPAEVPARSADLLGVGADPRSPSLAALLTRSLAGTLGVTTGQEVAVEDVAGRRLRLVVAGLVDQLPADPFRADGTPLAVVDLADLARAEAATPAPPPVPEGEPRPQWPLPPRAARQWWLLPAPGTDVPTVAARALAAVRTTTAGANGAAAAGGPVTVTRVQAERGLLDEPITSGIGRLHLVGAAALTLAAVGALLLGQLASTRRRRGELAVLRAVGFSTAQARRLALAEALLVGGLAVLAGVLLGVGLARWSTTQLAGLAGERVPGGVPAAAVLAVAGVLTAGVLAVAVVRARAAVTGEVPALVREQVT